MTHSYAYINKSTALGKTRELLTTSGGAPKPEPELWVRVAQQARALGDLAGSIISMWIVEELGANPHQLGELRGLHVLQMHDNAAEDGNASYYRCIKMHVNAPDTECIVMQQM